MNGETPLVEFIDEPDESGNRPLVEILGTDGEALTGVKLEVTIHSVLSD